MKSIGKNANPQLSIQEFIGYSKKLAKKLKSSLMFFSSSKLENKYLSKSLSLFEDFVLLIDYQNLNTFDLQSVDKITISSENTALQHPSVKPSASGSSALQSSALQHPSVKPSASGRSALQSSALQHPSVKPSASGRSDLQNMTIKPSDFESSNINEKCEEEKDRFSITLFVPFPPQVNPYISIDSIKDMASIYDCISSIRNPLGVEFERMNAKEYEKISKFLEKKIKIPLFDITSYFDDFFSVKDEDSLAKISKSAMLSDLLFKRLYLAIKKGKVGSEHGAYEFINYSLKRLCLEPAFSPIIANSSNSSNIHHLFHSKKPFKKGFVLVDLGVKYEGFCSDLSRMIYLGTPFIRERELFNLVCLVQNKSLAYVKKDILYREIDYYARQIFGIYKGNFNHLLGHGLGYYAHEAPSFSKFSEDKVRKNQVFTIEPGIYFKGKYGIRIEDSCYFDGEKAISLTKTKKQLFLV
ncbi:MAG TPA: M24 family metallopeptidase [Candidatus Woesearchaeota archaeon]|nr:M24 family metallopeptidase [Candidatus Woesearchaeota archaeon]